MLVSTRFKCSDEKTEIKIDQDGDLEIDDGDFVYIPKKDLKEFSEWLQFELEKRDAK